MVGYRLSYLHLIKVSLGSYNMTGVTSAQSDLSQFPSVFTHYKLPGSAHKKNPNFRTENEYKTLALNKLERKSTVYRIQDTIRMPVSKVATHKVTLSGNSLFQKTGSQSYLI